MGCVALYTPCCIWRADGLGGNRRVMGRATEATADCLWFVAECFVAPIALAGKHDLRISRGKRGVTRIATVSTSAGRWSMRAIAGLLWRSIPRAVSDWWLARGGKRPGPAYPLTNILIITGYWPRLARASLAAAFSVSLSLPSPSVSNFASNF